MLCCLTSYSVSFNSSDVLFAMYLQKSLRWLPWCALLLYLCFIFLSYILCVFILYLQKSSRWLLWLTVLCLLLSVVTCRPSGRGRRAPAIFSPDREGYGTSQCSTRDYKDCYLCGMMSDDFRIYKGCCERRRDFLAFCDRLLS